MPCAMRSFRWSVLGLQFSEPSGRRRLSLKLFSPGLGSGDWLNAIWRRDYPVIMGTVLVFSFTLILANLLVDILYTILDPRIRYT